ncbi:hypothetical protein Tco_0989500 [Tanacetum coccineum]|uniref:CCHC-type domain-containing protein n=1 Tax=Tanacetum coccineum TaxID=301880 RepID=A0ABQ5ETV9_9ASTR
MAGSDDENPPPPPPQQTPTQQAPHTVSTIKLLILKKDTNEVIKVLPPKTAKEILARERERKARTTLLMALLEDHLAKFHKMIDAKEMWDAIKSRFSGVSTEDANQKFLRSFPSSWAHISLVMRTKPGVDSLSFDDLYNNLRVFVFDVKGSTRSSSSSQNVTFVSSESTSSINDVSTAYGVSTSSGYNSQRENSSSYTDELMYSLFANQSSGLHLDHEDLEQLDKFELEEMDLKWQVAMISMRLKKFYKIGRRLQFDSYEPVGFDKTKVECYNCHNTRHFSRECKSKGNQDSRRRDAGNTRYRAKDNGRTPGKQEEPKALVTLGGEGVDWTGHAEDEQDNFTLMAYSNSGSDIEMSTRDKSGLGYGDQAHEGVLSYENEVFQSVFDSRSSDVEDSPVHDRFANVEGMHAVPPPMTGNYIPLGLDREINLKSVPEPVVVEPKVVCQPKVQFDAPIIEEYESDSDDEY